MQSRTAHADQTGQCQHFSRHGYAQAVNYPGKKLGGQLGIKPQSQTAIRRFERVEIALGQWFGDGRSKWSFRPGCRAASKMNAKPEDHPVTNVTQHPASQG